MREFHQFGLESFGAAGPDIDDTLMKDTERDHWMTAEEALNYGIVDKILVSKKF